MEIDRVSRVAKVDNPTAQPKGQPRDSKTDVNGKRGVPKTVSMEKALSKKEKRQDKDAEKTALLEKGKQRGFVTYDEILKAFPSIESDVVFLEEIYDEFAVSHIDAVEG